MKWIITLIMVLMATQLVYGIKDCESIMNPSDLPCLILSSWEYPNDCNTYTVNIFNETPALLSTIIMGDYSEIGKCNITFNYSKTGSYFLKFSSGDTAIINVEADEMAYITIGILLGIITFVFAFFTVKVKQWGIQIALGLLTLVMIVFDFFISARIIEIIDSTQTGIIHSLDTFFFIAVTLFRFALAGAIIFLIYYMYKYVLISPFRKRRIKEERFLNG